MLPETTSSIHSYPRPCFHVQHWSFRSQARASRNKLKRSVPRVVLPEPSKERYPESKFVLPETTLDIQIPVWGFQKQHLIFRYQFGIPVQEYWLFRSMFGLPINRLRTENAVLRNAENSRIRGYAHVYGSSCALLHTTPDLLLQLFSLHGFPECFSLRSR